MANKIGAPLCILRIENKTDKRKQIKLIDAANSIHKCDDDGNYCRDGIVIKSQWESTNYREILYCFLSADYIIGSIYIKVVNSTIKGNKLKSFIIKPEYTLPNGSKYTDMVLFKIDPKQVQKSVSYALHTIPINMGSVFKLIMNIEPYSCIEIRIIPSEDESKKYSSVDYNNNKDLALLSKLNQQFNK